MGALLAPPREPFRAEILPISDAIAARMANKSWRGDDDRCPRLADLAHLTVDHVTFEGHIARGELVVAADLALRAAEVFRRLYQLGFPIRQIKLVDDFDASDDR